MKISKPVKYEENRFADWSAQVTEQFTVLLWSKKNNHQKLVIYQKKIFLRFATSPKTKTTGFKNPMVAESELHNWPEIPNLANSNSINN